MKKNFFLSRDNLNIYNKIIFIDGFSGTGKSLLGSILSHLPKAEQWQVDYFYENIAIFDYINQIPYKSAKALCEVKASEAIYNLFIGRNVNFRPTDVSSPINNGLKKKYTERLKKREKIYAFNEIKNSNPILIFNVHYLFGYSRFLFDVFWKQLKLYVLMMRDPFYLIDYWYTGHLSSNRGKNKLDFGLCIEVNKKLMPWYTKEYTQEFLKANHFEKSILTISELYKRLMKMFNKLDDNELKKIQIIFFEDFLAYPDEYMNLLCKKTNIKRDLKFNNTFMKTISKSKKNLFNSKIIDYNIFQSKYKKKISPKFEKILLQLDNEYKKFYSKNKI